MPGASVCIAPWLRPATMRGRCYYTHIMHKEIKLAYLRISNKAIVLHGGFELSFVWRLLQCCTVQQDTRLQRLERGHYSLGVVTGAPELGYLGAGPPELWFSHTCCATLSQKHHLSGPHWLHLQAKEVGQIVSKVLSSFGLRRWSSDFRRYSSTWSPNGGSVTVSLKSQISSAI